MEIIRRSKTASLCRLVAVFVLLGSVSSPSSLRSEESSYFSVAMSYVNRTMRSFSTRFGAENEGTSPTTTNPEDTAKRAALDDLMRSIFHQEKGSHFTQSKWGAKAIPYQLEGIQTIKLGDASTNHSDHEQGIDQRITFEFKVKAFRQYDESKGWGEWVQGNPPHFDSVTLVRQNGTWKVSASPAWAYSLR